VLAWLRIVGRSVTLDDIEELSAISQPTIHNFFHQFNLHAREDLFPIHVKMPSTLKDLMEVESAYASIGFPGACGSMDVVHIPLGRCPMGLSNVCTGKEGYPTLGYNVICDHRGRALALMPGAYGTINDKTIVKHDDAVEKVKTDSLYTNYSYQVYNDKNQAVFTEGAYLIVDGGYLRWKCLQCGLKSHSDEKYVKWRKKLESVRKDIECFFGRLKQRFKILKIPNLLQDKTKIDNLVFALFAIQNMIMDHKIARDEMSNWTIQWKWQELRSDNGKTVEEFLDDLKSAEEEDITEETDNMWFQPIVKKKMKRNGVWYSSTL